MTEAEFCLSDDQILDALLFDEIQHLLNHFLNVSDENEMKSLPPFISMWSAACNISLFFSKCGLFMI